MDAQPTSKLPPLRNGITFAFNDYDIEGKPQWLIHDAGNNKFFLIGWLEHEIISRWHMGDVTTVLNSIRNETTLHVEMVDIENFYKFLASHFLIKQTGYQILGQAKQQNLFKDENVINWLIGHYLFFRIPLCKPDAFLIKTAWIGRILFSRTTFWIMMAIGTFALWQLSNRWEEFTHTFSSIFTMQGLMLYFVAFSGCKLLHELGHAWMCRSYGIPVPTLGVAFLVFWPVLYTDTTLSWSLTSHQRLRIALAGMWAETYIVIISALIWCNTNILTLKSIVYLVISVNWVASLLINVSPFMRFDGYYVLSDLLRMPNLQPRAFALTRWQLRRWMFNWPEPAPEEFGRRLRYFLVVYSLFTWIYRLILYIGIAILVYSFFIKIVGIILFLIEVHYFILRPLNQEAVFWYKNRDKFSLNIRTNITILFTLSLLFMCFYPISQTVHIPATISYYHQVIYAPEAGILQTPIPPEGTLVKKGDVIAKLYSPWLEQAMKEILLEYREMQNSLRRAQVNQKYSNQKNILLSDISHKQSEYNKLQQRREKLIIKAPFDGRIADTQEDIPTGTTIQKNEWLVDITDPQQAQIEGYVPETELNRIRPGLTGDFYPLDLEEASVPVTVKTIEILNTKELNCHLSTAAKENKGKNPPLETPCYNINEFGGKVPVFLTDSGSYVPASSVYLAIFNVNESKSLPHIANGIVQIKTTSRSWFSKVAYHTKKTLIEQSGF